MIRHILPLTKNVYHCSSLSVGCTQPQLRAIKISKRVYKGRGLFGFNLVRIRLPLYHAVVYDLNNNTSKINNNNNNKPFLLRFYDALKSKSHLFEIMYCTER